MSGGRSLSWGAGAGAWAGDGGNNWGGAAMEATKPAWQVSVKKPVAATGKGPAVPQGPQAAFKVTSKHADVTHKTLCGSYVEKGENHGRKTYKKLERIAGHESVDVFLYYWDQRDGADFSGWWFGDQVGGTQVWSRAALHTPAPPKAGWCIPWDSKKPEPGALTVEPVSTTASPAVAAPLVGKAASGAPKGAGKGAQASAATSNNAAALAQRFKVASEKVTKADAETKSFITVAQKAIENKAGTEAMLKVQLDKMEAQKTKLAELQTSLNSDMVETRKGGGLVNDYAKLTATVKTCSTSVATELFKVKSAHQKFAADAKKAADEKATKAAEEKAKLEFKTILPKITLEITKIDNAVNLVEKSTVPLINNPPDDGEDKAKKLDKVEKDAEEAQKKFSDVRTDLNTKITNARKYTGETKTEALKELNALQVKLQEAQKKLNPLKSFKKEFAGRIAAIKALKEITDKVVAFEPEVKKLTTLVAASESCQMSEEDVTEADSIINPGNVSLQQVLSTINNKTKGANPATQTELEALRIRVSDLKKKLDAASSTVKLSRQNISVQKGLVAASEKVDKAEACLAKCQDAEMPFLKGIEVLPKEESDEALGASDKTGAAAHAAASAAMSFLKQQVGQSKNYPKELQQSVEEQLKPLQKRASVVETKVANFRRETAERKMAALLSEVVEGVTTAEEKVSKLVDSTSMFVVEKLDEASVESLKESSKVAEVLAKDAHTAIDEARKNSQAKQRQATVGDAAAALSKIGDRLKVAQDKLTKARSSIQLGDKCSKAKQICEQQAEKLTAAEANIEKIEGLAGGDDANLTEANVKVLDECMASAWNALKPIQQAIQPHMSTPAPKLKASLQDILDRKTKATEKLNKSKSSTKALREKVLGDAFTKEAEAKVAVVEAAIKTTSDAELPFLKGIEVLPLKEATDTVAASEKAISAARDALKQAQEYIRSKTGDVKEFAEDAKKSVMSCFSGLNLKIAEANQTLMAFNKETIERKHNAQVRDADVKVGEVEEASKLAIVAAEPFAKEDAKDLSEDAITGLIEKFMESEKAFKAKLTETRTFVQARERDVQGKAANKETLKKLQTRLSESQSALATSRKPMAVHEDKFTAKRLLAEAKEAVSKLDSEMKSATDACAPLLEQKGEDYLVTASIASLSQALLAHGREKDLDEEAVYKGASGGKKLSQKKFLEYLAGLAAAIGHEEVDFSEERRTNIFKKLDADKDGFCSKDEFKAMFKTAGIVKREISVTEGFSIADSKVLGKVVPGDKVEIFGVPKEDEAKMVRSQCKLLKDDTICWVTLTQANTCYVQPTSNAFHEFVKGMDAAVASGDASVRKTVADLEAKLRQLSASNSAPLKEAKEEMTKLKLDCNTVLASFKDLKVKVIAGKEGLKAKEKEEKNAHVIAKEIKEAKEFYASVTPKVEDLEAAVLSIEEKAKAFTDAEDKDKFETPASLLDEVEKLCADAVVKVDAARTLAKEQMQLAVKASPATAATGRAKKQIQQYLQQIDKSGKGAASVLAKLTQQCNVVADKHIIGASKALRDEAAKKGSAEKLFADLAKKSDKITDAAFSKKLSALGVGINAEHAKLLSRRIGSGGVSQHGFLSFVQLFYVVVKDIAITDNADIQSCTTIRKVERKEILEVLEGPITDDKVGITRVRAKLLLDGATGWVSVNGNQGTPFLERREKPLYCVRKQTTLDNIAKGGGGAVRTLRETEILELIGGPQVEEIPDAQKARVKASKDGAQGWVTLIDRDATTFAEANNKLYVCKAAVAMTDALDIQSSKVLRKLAIDEQFVATTGELVEDAVAGICRLQGKALKDDKEGWITTKGNAGTVFAELTPKMYSVIKDVNVYKRPVEDAKEIVRKLEAGETFKMLEGPKVEKMEAENRIKVRAVSDNAIGWISSKPAIVKNWAPLYKCIVPTPIRDTRGNTEVTKSLREIGKGELFEHVEGPFFEDEEIIMKGRAKRDGVIGWVALKAKDGKMFFEN